MSDEPVDVYAPPAEPGGVAALIRPAVVVAVVFAVGCVLLILGSFGRAAYRLGNPPTHSDQAMARGMLRTVHTAQSLYRKRDPVGDGVPAYGTLSELSRSSLIDRVLGSGRKQGYRFTCTPSAVDSTTAWLATASPVASSPAQEHFAINQDGVLMRRVGAPFPSDPDAAFPADAAPVPRE